MVVSLNINSIAPKLDQLRIIIGNYLDVLTIQETKLDGPENFPTGSLLTIHIDHISKNRFLGHLAQFGPKSRGP